MTIIICWPNETGSRQLQAALIRRGHHVEVSAEPEAQTAIRYHPPDIAVVWHRFETVFNAAKRVTQGRVRLIAVSGDGHVHRNRRVEAVFPNDVESVPQIIAACGF